MPGPTPTPETAQIRGQPLELPGSGAATSPHITTGPGGLVLSWWEDLPEGPLLMHASPIIGTGTEARPVNNARSALVNWADVPTVIETPGGWFATWPGPAEGHAYDVMMSRSTDGEQWSAPVVAHSDGTRTEHGFVSLAQHGEQVWMTWLDGRLTASGGPMTLRARRLDPQHAASELVDARVCDCCGTDALVTSEGPLVAYRGRTEEEIRDIRVARRTEEGWVQAWSSDDAWTIRGCPVNGPALDASGTHVALAWYTEAPDQRVRLAMSSDSGAHFGEPIDLATGPGVMGRVDVATLPGGQTIVSWLMEHGQRARIMARSVDHRGNPGPAVAVGETTSGRASGFPVLGVHDGRLVWVWTVPGSGLEGRMVEPDRLAKGP